MAVLTILAIMIHQTHLLDTPEYLGLVGQVLQLYLVK
jgi:hypothetical protein